MDLSKVTAVRWHRWFETQICSTPKPETAVVILNFHAHGLLPVPSFLMSCFATPKRVAYPLICDGKTLDE